MLIVFEGMDGAGKTTYIEQYMKSYMLYQKRDSQFVRDPGGTKISERIRDVIANIQDKNRKYELYVLARHYLTQKIEDLIRQYYVIIADRFWPSTIVHQEFYNKLTLSEPFVRLDRKLPIDALFYFKVSPVIALQRKPEEDMRTLEEIDECYDQFFKEYKGSKYLIDADASMNEVHEQVMKHLPSLLKAY